MGSSLIPPDQYGMPSICKRCRKPMLKVYGSGVYCSSYCSHSRPTWNKGKKIGPAASLKAWKTRRESPGYEEERKRNAQHNAERMRQGTLKYWRELRKDPVKMAARIARVKRAWAARLKDKDTIKDTVNKASTAKEKSKP